MMHSFFGFFKSNEEKDPLEISKAMIQFLDENIPDIENSRLQTIMSNISKIIKSSSSDFEAMQKGLEYMLLLPVQVGDHKKQSYGELLTQCIPPETLSPYDPLTNENLEYLEDFFDKFLNDYRPVSHTWHYSYDQNENGEILTKGIAEWQNNLTQVDSTNLEKDIADFRRSVAINGKKDEGMSDEQISKNIDLFCDQLKEPVENKKLFKAWLKKHGGQESFAFIATPIKENHMAENINIGRAFKKNMNWTIEPAKTNTQKDQLTFSFEADIMTLSSLSSGCIYSKLPGKTFITATKHHDDIDTVFNNLKEDKLDPLLKMKGKVILVIEKDNNQQSVVVPKLKNFEIDCNASICITESGRLLLQSPKNNAALIKELRQGIQPSKSVNLKHSI